MLNDLNVRQGRLLIILIDRELGKTAFDLLCEYLNYRRAMFWQRFAWFVGADLKTRYSTTEYPLVEKIVLEMGAEPWKTEKNQEEK